MFKHIASNSLCNFNYLDNTPQNVLRDSRKVSKIQGVYLNTPEVIFLSVMITHPARLMTIKCASTRNQRPYDAQRTVQKELRVTYNM